MPIGLSDNLFKRIVSALTLLPIVLGLVYMGGWWFFALLVCGGLLMFWEWCELTGVSNISEKLIFGSGILVFTSVAAYYFFTYPTNFTTIALLGLPLLGLAVISPKKLAVNAGPTGKRVLNAFGGEHYVTLALVSLLWLRSIDDNGLIVVWLFFAVWAMDVGGYFAGKGIGGPKLAPKLSPKKTWAGLIGGMVLAAVVSAIISILFDLATPVWLALAGAAVAVVAQLGDLYESAVKRALNAKDSGNLIPGHGGILDRVDGLVFAAPVVALTMASLQVIKVAS